MSEQSLPPLHDEPALLAWIESRSAWEEYRPLLELESPHLERRVLNRAPGALFREEVVEEMQERAARSRTPALLLVPLLSNPDLPRWVVERVVERALEYLKGATSRDVYPDQPGLHWLGMLEAAGHPVPDSFWDWARERLHGRAPASEEERTWAAYYLMQWATALRREDAEVVYEVVRGSYPLVEQLLRHPSTPTWLHRRTLAELGDWEERFLFAIARHPQARLEPDLRSRLLHVRQDRDEMALLLIESASVEEAGYWWEKAHCERRRLLLLERLRPEQAGVVELRQVTRLLRSPEPEVRLRVQRAWARLQPQEPDPLAR